MLLFNAATSAQSTNPLVRFARGGCLLGLFIILFFDVVGVEQFFCQVAEGFF